MAYTGGTGYAAGQSFDVQNFVRDDIAPKIVDTVLRSNVFLQILLSEKKSRFIGKNKVVNIKYRKQGNGGSFSGLDTFATNFIDTTLQLVFTPSFYEQPMVFAGTDLSIAKSPEAITDYYITRGQEVAQEMADGIGTMLYGDGTGNSGKDFLGLKAIVDDGTLVATYGGLNRGTYTEAAFAGGLDPSRTGFGVGSLIGGNVKSSVGTLTLDILDSGYRAAWSGNFKPTIIVTTKDVYRILEKLFQPVTNMQMVKYETDKLTSTKGVVPLMAQQGYASLYYKGMPVLVDEKCPTGYLFMLNMDTLEFPVLDMWNTDPLTVATSNINGQYSENMEKAIGFSIGKLVTPVNQYGMIQHLYFGGQFYCTNPKFNTTLSGITG